MANSEPPHREVFETDEYTAPYDDIIKRHMLDVVGPVLDGVVEGIAKNPRAMERLTGNIWMEKSKYFGLTVPRFTIFFSIEGDSPQTERVLLLWIEENTTTEEIGGI
jgi:hypothetical protein